jgi:cytidine deaminase
LAESDRGRLSVSVVDVAEGHEAEFHDVSKRLQTILERKGYGRAETFRDEAVPTRYYVVRRWAGVIEAESCHGDIEVQGLTSKLHTIARVTHVVNGVRRPDPLRLMLDDRRTGGVEPDRRTGFDRRVADRGTAEGERRSHRDRRLGPRRLGASAGDINLVAAARRAREHADAAFSRFKVGAAIETADGAVITGCNIENATYGLTICAERVAIFKALSEGHRAFTRIAIVADSERPAPPCGACRQVLWEFGGNLEVQLANLSDEKGAHWLKDLLPLPFDARLL